MNIFPVVPHPLLSLTYLYRRLRAPKRSPGATPTQTYFDPLPSPGVEATSPSGQQLGSGQKPLYLCQPFVKAALVKGSFKTIVAPPKYVDVNEWVAVNRMPIISLCSLIR
jgi:hypothetical protein